MGTTTVDMGPGAGPAGCDVGALVLVSMVEGVMVVLVDVVEGVMVAVTQAVVVTSTGTTTVETGAEAGAGCFVGATVLLSMVEGVMELVSRVEGVMVAVTQAVAVAVAVVVAITHAVPLETAVADDATAVEFRGYVATTRAAFMANIMLS